MASQKASQKAWPQASPDACSPRRHRCHEAQFAKSSHFQNQIDEVQV
jgi:hypothetical protein